MTDAAITNAIPHRGPMLLVDTIEEQTKDRIICTKTFHADEFFFQGHYPDHPLVPGVILCEATMQAGAILLYSYMTAGGGVPVATRINDVKLKKMVQPGDQITMEVTLNERVGDAFFLTGKTTCQGKVAVRFDFGCTVAKPPGA
ncbi:MAG: beta-hydroxyacyl-ACP dehydratase [bacterium]|nr:beta-hydroxyacyl-ACP dehydratase [bacterium]